MHGSSLAMGSLERAQQLPRPPTLPRPISTDNLGRVASLAYGIPGVRTRAQLAAEPAAASTPETETEEETEEETFSPDSDVVLSPHAVPRTRSAACQPAEEDAAAGAMFAADDLPAGRTASTTLRDVRGIRTAQQVQQAGEKELSEAAASDGREVSEELPVSVSPPDAEAISIAAPAAAVPTPPAGTAEHLAEETAATPAYRSAALHRLTQIFGGLRGGPSEGRAMQGGGLTAAAAEEDEGDEEAGPLPLEAALPLSPVQKYISYRQGKRLARKEAQRAAAAAEDREPPPPTPLPASLSGFGGLLGSITPRGLLASSQWEAAQQAAASTPRELMREAMDQEVQDAAQEHDPTGTLIISMLSKKLERMAAEERRQQRLRRRAARKAAAAAAAAADGAAAPPPAEPEAAAGRAAGAQPRLEPELKEGPSAVQLGEQAAERPLGFGAALKRLLSNPEVDAFFAITAILGFGHGIIGSFLFMFLAEQGGSEMLMGYVLMANALPELPAFFFFGRILATLGMNTVLLTAAASLGVRIWAYALLPRIGLHWVVVIEGLHAVTYACGWSASAVNSSKIAPPGLESTTQAIFQGLWTGVGCGVAGLLGGVLYGTHGPLLLFQASGLAILGSTALAAAVLVSVRWRRKHRPALLPSSESFDKLPVAGH